MKIILKPNNIIELIELNDFQSFSLETSDSSIDDDQVVAGFGPDAKVAGDGEFWISADRVRLLAGHHADAEWHRNFTAMLSKVRPYGWASDDLTQIRVHLNKP
ncbi:MAG: hypothetical protein P1U88_22310 [Thalassobaculaceae bacterium]|nr:hypothetical protein [Thalassobaculaceae bacterium]